MYCGLADGLNGGQIIAIVAIVGCIFFPIVLVGFIVFLKTREKKRCYELEADLYAKAIEKGMEVPKDLFTGFKGNKPKTSSLEKGIILIAVGIGLGLFLLFVDGGSHITEAAVGFIPAIIGVGYLLIHFLVKKQKTKDD
jgi:hypothetical protein